MTSDKTSVGLVKGTSRRRNAYNALDNVGKTMEYLMTALDIAPLYRPAQQLLLELSRTQN